MPSCGRIPSSWALDAEILGFVSILELRHKLPERCFTISDSVSRAWHLFGDCPLIGEMLVTRDVQHTHIFSDLHLLPFGTLIPPPAWSHVDLRSL